MADSTPLDMDSPVDGMPIARNDGGPAFPARPADMESGMSLRDYFAAQVSTSLLVARVTETSAYVDYAASATAAYAMADAMLKEREK